MKKIVRKTGEIIDVITYTCGTTPEKSDVVNYVDGEGNYKSAKLNYYWDLEDIDDNKTEEEYWKEFRSQAALSILNGILSHSTFRDDWMPDVDKSVTIANYLVKKLKENEN